VTILTAATSAECDLAPVSPSREAQRLVTEIATVSRHPPPTVLSD
jgi:hypothetical protein